MSASKQNQTLLIHQPTLGCQSEDRSISLGGKRASLNPPGPYAWVQCLPGEAIKPKEKEREEALEEMQRQRCKAQLQEANMKKRIARVERNGCSGKG